MELYFTEPANISTSYAEFDAFESRHILKTMRKKEGELIYFTDGRGHLYSGSIEVSHPVLRVSYQIEREDAWPPPIQSVLGIAVIRPARLDILIEKATELGITRFVLFTSRYSTYPLKNTKRWQKISRQAIKQSNRIYLPEIQLVSGIKDFFYTVSDIPLKLIAQQNAARRLADLLAERDITQEQNIAVLIGPEGGFDHDEESLAAAHNFLPFNLGVHRLRTETAAISAASFINGLRN
jgi:16S rRNA (uracil1498-N3)-methyltransferase